VKKKIWFAGWNAQDLPNTVFGQFLAIIEKRRTVLVGCKHRPKAVEVAETTT
jgi:hypothetical protein